MVITRLLLNVGEWMIESLEVPGFVDNRRGFCLAAKCHRLAGDIGDGDDEIPR